MIRVGLLLAAIGAHPNLASAQDGPTDADAPHILILAPPTPSRPAMLMPLYVGNIALQAYDGYSTLRGVHEGVPETNPLVGGLASRPAAFWAMKAASAATSILLTERLWRQHHAKQAVVWMIITNGAMAAVAARNAANLTSVR